MDAPEIEKLKALALAAIDKGTDSALQEFQGEALPEHVLALVADAERYRALRDLMQNAKGSASITVNQHLAYYEQCEPGEEVVLQWYPDTPIGFYTIEGSTLDQVADEAIEFIASKA